MVGGQKVCNKENFSNLVIGAEMGLKIAAICVITTSFLTPAVIYISFFFGQLFAKVSGKSWAPFGLPQKVGFVNE